MGLIYRNAIIENDLKYGVQLSCKNFEIQQDKILFWLADNFGNGEENGLWNISDSLYITRRINIRFKYEDTAMAFKLAWI